MSDESSSEIECLTDGGQDPFYDVEECGRHIVKAGHGPNCPNRSDDAENNELGGENDA
ncbi:hypothetical protein HLRTI_000522 [Halorhabdus tiamatea SARL4B]|uniref:Uncharacterized protein n=1 Tax=Halorhabdus tiamatea SARL4B TaxID=1033806 RepID=U2FH12_9EURY|nr:hypothetical protein [Halorhabdus tiamatea]ERJ07479.1 hypothetical protein HLRTI_000522 [Halorhabdus tiamatea SARL4B]